MFIALASAHAALPGPLFEPAVQLDGGTLEVSGQTYGVGPHWISGARVSLSAAKARLVGNLDLRFLDDIYASDHWDLRSINLMLGYRVVDHRIVQVMPYVRGGSHLQAGIALRVALDLKVADLVFDASAGPIFDLPESFTTTGADFGARSHPGLPEAGAAIAFHHPLHPALRVGVVGDQPVISGSIGKTFYVRGAFAHALHAPRGFGWLGVGVAL